MTVTSSTLKPSHAQRPTWEQWDALPLDEAGERALKLDSSTKSSIMFRLDSAGRTRHFSFSLGSVTHRCNLGKNKHPPVFLAFVSVGETRHLMTTGFLGTLLRTTELLGVLSRSASVLCRDSAACWGFLGCICCSDKKKREILTDEGVWRGDKGLKRFTVNLIPNQRSKLAHFEEQLKKYIKYFKDVNVI